MKAIKVTVSLVVLLVVIAGGFIMYGLSNLNGFVEEIIETAGTEATTTKVDVGSVDIKLTEASGTIYNLSVANPEGYSSNNLFAAKSLGLTIDAESITETVKVIKHVDIGEISLRAEQKNIKDTNVQTLLDNMQSTNSESEQAASNGDDVRIMIEKVSFASATIDLHTEKFGSRSVSLPSFTLQNIGEKSKGLTPQQAGETIVKQLMAKVRAAVKGEVKKLLREEAKAKLKAKANEIKAEAKEKFNDKADEVKDKLKDKISTDQLDSLFN